MELGLALVDRLRAARRDRPSLVLKVTAARPPDGRPGLIVSVVNSGPKPVVLESVGVQLRGGGRFGVDAQPPRLDVADKAIAWIDLATLAERASVDDPVAPITAVFAATTLGSASLKVDALALLAELAVLYPARGPAAPD